MAFEAPTHREWRESIDNFHLINPTMAFDAANSAIHMGTVIEIGEVGKLVNLDPLHRHATLIGLSDLFKLGAIALNLGVTVHASLGGRHGGERSAINRGVAIAAIESEFSNMPRVAIRHRLHRLIANIKRLGTQPIGHKECGVERSDRASNQNEWQERICPTRKEESAHKGSHNIVLFFTISDRTERLARRASRSQGFTTLANELDFVLVNPVQKIEIASAATRVACLDVSAALAFIATRAQARVAPGLTEETLRTALAQREAIASTSTPEGVAFPHAIRVDVPTAAACVIIMTLAQPIQWGSNRVEIVVALFGSPVEPWRHVRTLARVARVCSQASVRAQLMACTSEAELFELFSKECNSHE